MDRADMKTPADALRLVPVEATSEMLDAGVEAAGWLFGPSRSGQWPDADRVSALYKVMLSAAPASPLPEGGGWQDISTAPKDGTPILITRPTSYPAEEAYHVVRWEEVDGFWFCHDGKSDTWLRGPDPTHWMPLPAAPTGDRP